MNRWIVSTFCLGLVALDQVAIAQSSVDKAQAEHLFQEGLTLFDAGEHAEACKRFEQSQIKDPKPSTLINLGLCHEKIGRTASAWQELVEARNAAERKGDTELAATARREVDRLAKVVPKIRVRRQSKEPSAITITLDQSGFDLTLLDTALPLDPGPHRIEIAAIGYVTLSHTFEVPAGTGITDIAIPALQALPKDPDKIDKVQGPLPEKTEKPKPVEPSSGMSPMVPAGFIGGGASLLLGIITGSVSLAMTSSLKDSCDAEGTCSADSSSDLSTANALANVANVGFALAGVGAVVGVIGLFVGGDEPGAGVDTKAKLIAPISVGDAGLGVQIRF